jgi:hypothetical protein
MAGLHPAKAALASVKHMPNPALSQSHAPELKLIQ